MTPLPVPGCGQPGTTSPGGGGKGGGAVDAKQKVQDIRTSCGCPAPFVPSIVQEKASFCQPVVLVELAGDHIDAPGRFPEGLLCRKRLLPAAAGAQGADLVPPDLNDAEFFHDPVLLFDLSHEKRARKNPIVTDGSINPSVKL